MEPVLVTCDGCGARIRTSRPDRVLDRVCPLCGAALRGVLVERPSVPEPADAAVARSTLSCPPGLACSGPLRALLACLDPGRWIVPGLSIVAIIVSIHSIVTRLANPYVHAAPAIPQVVAHPPSRACRADSVLRTKRAHTENESPLLARREAVPGETRSDTVATAARVIDEKADVPAASADPKRTDVELGPKRIRVRMRSDKTVVARVIGAIGDDVHIMLPDGQIGMPDRLAYTDEPFRAATKEEMAAELLAGPFAKFEVKYSEHYVLLYQSSEAFAENCSRDLENLYRGLVDAFEKFEIPTVEAEFPLVAVIFRSERDFRAHKKIDQQIQAYYEVYTNRICFYEASDRDEKAPEVAALRRPQTVAHEGTHQILQNIGIQPRLAPWPAWLIEGLAEYCSSPYITKKSTSWGGLGMVNPIHMATIRDLADPLSGQVEGANKPEHIGRPKNMSLVEYLVKKTELNPTDYALSWAMTHYLAMKRVGDFVTFLKTMSALPPLEKRTPDDHLALFRAAFRTDLGKLDHDIDVYLGKLKVTHQLPYYAVMVRKQFGDGLMHREALVSQSPSVIRQWLETVGSPHGEPPVWEALPYPSRARAVLMAEAWMRER